MSGYKKRTIDIFPGTGVGRGPAGPGPVGPGSAEFGGDAVRLGLIEESPLSIRIQGNPHAVVMRTPGDELAQVAGFCLAEGIADHPADIANLAYCGEDVNVVTATLSPERLAARPDVIRPRPRVSQTSCGICGKELVSDLVQDIRPVPRQMTVDPGLGLDCLERLSGLQTRHHCSHAAAVFGRDGGLLSVGEDVGRHNALDKAVGALFLTGELGSAGLLVLSSRVSYELVQKAGRAGIPVIFSVSGPTALAVDLAERLDMTVACPNKRGELFVFCGGHRLVGERSEAI